MKIKSLFPKYNIPITFKDLGDNAGQYWTKSDIIVLDAGLKKSMPGVAKIVFLHEMIHSTAHGSRLNRWERLEKSFDEYEPGSKSWRVEECIAEIGTMVCAMKLGMLNQYTNEIIVLGLKENYAQDLYIPWREVVSAVRYFANDDEDFSKELTFIKKSIQDVYGIRVCESYERKDNSAA